MMRRGRGWVFSPPPSVGRVPSGEPLCSRCPTSVSYPLSDTLFYVSYMFRCVSYGHSIYVFRQFSFLFLFRSFVHISTIVCVLSFLPHHSRFLFLLSFPRILIFIAYVLFSFSFPCCVLPFKCSSERFCYQGRTWHPFFFALSYVRTVRYVPIVLV